MARAPLLADADVTVRDLNNNGKHDPFEDLRRPIDQPVAGLLGRMTPEE
jgi:beta-glucosidase